MTRVLKVKVGPRWFTVEVDDLATSPIHVLVDGEPVEVEIEAAAGDLDLPGEVTESPLQAAGSGTTPSQATSAAPTVRHTIRAPMPGVIVSVGHSIGDHIAVGDEACVLESMKMQQSIRSDGAGSVARILVQPGQQVRGGEALIELS